MFFLCNSFEESAICKEIALLNVENPVKEKFANLN